MNNSLADFVPELWVGIGRFVVVNEELLFVLAQIQMRGGVEEGADFLHLFGAGDFRILAHPVQVDQVQVERVALLELAPVAVFDHEVAKVEVGMYAAGFVEAFSYLCYGHDELAADQCSLRLGERLEFFVNHRELDHALQLAGH